MQSKAYSEMDSREQATGISSGNGVASETRPAQSTGGLLSRFIQWQQRLSEGIDRFLPQKFRMDGATDFMRELVPAYLTPGSVIYDIGGGKHPLISPEFKSIAFLHIVGLDIDAGELARAPAGSYDEVICSPIGDYVGKGDADVVFCASVIEHVPDTEAALLAIAGILRTGGRAVFYVPCRNAIFARLNLILPEKLKRKLLFTLFPRSENYCGFPAYYDKCTPLAFERAANRCGLEVEVARYYWYSPYFKCFAPAYLMWRCWTLLAHATVGRQASEAFAVILRRTRPAGFPNIWGRPNSRVTRGHLDHSSASRSFISSSKRPYGFT